MAMVPVYEWVLSDGTAFGCGTRVEFEYWLSQGVNPEGSALGAVIAQEPAACDDRRRKAWGVA